MQNSDINKKEAGAGVIAPAPTADIGKNIIFCYLTNTLFTLSPWRRINMPLVGLVTRTPFRLKN